MLTKLFKAKINSREQIENLDEQINKFMVANPGARIEQIVPLTAVTPIPTDPASTVMYIILVYKMKGKKEEVAE